jgi:hypothetical protein
MNHISDQTEQQQVSSSQTISYGKKEQPIIWPDYLGNKVLVEDRFGTFYIDEEIAREILLQKNDFFDIIGIF